MLIGLATIATKTDLIAVVAYLSQSQACLSSIKFCIPVCQACVEANKYVKHVLKHIVILLTWHPSPEMIVLDTNIYNPNPIFTPTTNILF